MRYFWCDLKGFTCLAKKLEDSYFPPHKQLIKYDPQIMPQTAHLDFLSQHLTITTLMYYYYHHHHHNYYYY